MNNQQKKRRSVNRVQSRVNLLCVVARMWADVKTHVKTIETLSVKDYNQDNILGNVAIDDLRRYVTQADCPTYAQMCELRERLSQKAQSQSRQAKAMSDFSDKELEAEINRRKRSNGQRNLFNLK